MVELFFTSVTLLALIFAWKQWKIMMREVVRDELFDLRDEWRKYWCDMRMDMENPSYAYVRKRINQCLHYTADWRLADASYVSTNIKHIAPTVDAYVRHNDPRPNAPDRKTEDLAEKIRSRSVEVLRLYMVTTSPAAFPVAAVVAGLIVVKTMTWDKSISKVLDKMSELFSIGNSKAIESAVTLESLNFC